MQVLLSWNLQPPVLIPEPHKSICWLSSPQISVSVLHSSLWQVQGSSRGDATGMWYCGNVHWSHRGTHRKWALSPGFTPHNSDINGQSHHATRLPHSCSRVCRKEHDDRAATSWWQWETVSIITRQVSWAGKWHTFQPLDLSFSLNQIPHHISLVLPFQWISTAVAKPEVSWSGPSA
jgi:hypothetical protein